MRDEKKQMRHQAITEAAYDLLATKGYDGASMLSIAKAAKASNETLYRWYGDKRGLFEAMVRDNAQDIKGMLEQAIDLQDDPRGALSRVAPILLQMLTGERAVLLNRAAAADPSGELGAAIAAGGRDSIQPLVANLVQSASNRPNDQTRELTEWLFGLLIGDLQIRRVIGVLPAPSKTDIEKRSQNALNLFFKLLDES